MKRIEFHSPIRLTTFDWDFDEEIDFYTSLPVDMIEILILGAIEKYNQTQDPLRGLAEFMNSTPKLLSAKPTVRYIDNVLTGVCECFISNDLTPEEEKALIAELDGQYSDGWGEGFEQFDIPVGIHEYFNVSFWNPQLPNWEIKLYDPEKDMRITMDEILKTLREYRELVAEQSISKKDESK